MVSKSIINFASQSIWNMLRNIWNIKLLSYTDFYTKSFEISQVEFVSIIDLKDFDESKFNLIQMVSRLKNSVTKIFWESKLYDFGMVSR